MSSDPKPLQPLQTDPVQSVYARVGAEKIGAIVAAFYRQIPDDDILGPMYPAHDLAGAEERLRDFLIFRFGGPQTYLEKRGHPALRMRHRTFTISPAARERWVAMMGRALDETDVPEDVREPMRKFLGDVATFLINHPG